MSNLVLNSYSGYRHHQDEKSSSTQLEFDREERYPSRLGNPIERDHPRQDNQRESSAKDMNRKRNEKFTRNTVQGVGI